MTWVALYLAVTGAVVLDHYLEARRAMREAGRVGTAKPEWDEAVGIDVIGDWGGSKANAEYALAKGVTKGMPVFHIGDPWDLLTWYCERFPKVGLSCRFGEPEAVSLRFYEQCFARAWPHRFHSFGWVDDMALSRFPFHSADAATWGVAPIVYRRFVFKKRGLSTQKPLHVEGKDMMTFGVQQHMEAMWRREQQLQAQWAATLGKLDDRP